MIHYQENVLNIPNISIISYENKTNCHSRRYFYGRSHVLYDPADSFFEYIPLKGVKSNEWIEITHCGGLHTDRHEKNAFWAYITPGSGVFMYTGKTKILYRHIYLPENELKYYKKLGFDTIQYTHQNDQPCGTNAVEIIDLNINGTLACHPNLRSGYNASEMCNCAPRKSRWSKNPSFYPKHIGKKEGAIAQNNLCAFCTNMSPTWIKHIQNKQKRLYERW